MIDLHTHHERCGHADGTLADVARWAIELDYVLGSVHEMGDWHIYQPDTFADAGIAVEINGSGVPRDGRLFPDEPLLAGLVRRGVPISFGSDAHGSRQLGLGWDAARAALTRMGVRQLITFKRREPQWWTLE